MTKLIVAGVIVNGYRQLFHKKYIYFYVKFCLVPEQRSSTDVSGWLHLLAKQVY